MLPRLYAVIDRETLERRGLRVTEFAQQLRDGGVTLLQYRDKVGQPQQVLRVCREIEAVFHGTGASLVLNDRADLAALLGWGVHMGQGDLGAGDTFSVLGRRRRFPSYPSQQVRWPETPAAGMTKKADAARTNKREDKNCWVGVSTHTDVQVQQAELSAADYVAMGPVFATSTKADAEPVVGLEGVWRARALTAKPLVAIGGITLEKCGGVVEAGADTVAVVSGMFVPGRSVREVVRDFLQRMR